MQTKGQSKLRTSVQKKWLISFACFLAITFLVLIFTPIASAQTWSLVWSDEFNGAAGSAPSSADWTFILGKNNANGELEYYCPPGNNTSPCSASNPNIFEDGNGNLVIRAIHTPSGTWTSGRMNTSGKHTFQYGRMEARMKLVPGAGFWPAFWMLGSNIGTVGWPTCGEQDIMEWVPQYTPTTTSSTIHGPGYSGGNGIGRHFTFPNGGRIDDASYHTYGVVWSQNMMQFYRDNVDQPFFTVTSSDIPAGTQWVFNHPFYVLLNFAIGGNFPGPPNSSSPSPADVLVDYVRVYTQSQCTTCTQPAAINAGGPAVGAFAADTGFAGGTTINHANTINLTGVTNPAPMQVYQTARVGNFTYTISGLVGNTSHIVRLHFAETYWTAAGKRKFNVSINGAQVLTNFDIFATAGAMNKAVIEQFMVNANTSGQYVIQFTSVTDKSLISGIEVQ
jgi:beta-glucanase (GH16 family)